MIKKRIRHNNWKKKNPEKIREYNYENKKNKMIRTHRKKYNTKKDRLTPEQILKSKLVRHSLDRVWTGLTNSEKKEALLLFERANEERMKEIEESDL